MVLFQLRSLDAVGFDLDHCLIHDAIVAFLTSLHNDVARANAESARDNLASADLMSGGDGLSASSATATAMDVSRSSSRDRALLSTAALQGLYEDAAYLAEFDETFGIKGLVFEMPTGNLLTVDETGCIVKCFHGTRQMTVAEIETTYGGRQWHDFPALKSFARQDRFVHLSTYFNAPVAYLCARLVDLCDTRQIEYSFWSDIWAGFNFMFTPSAFASRQGHFFSALIDETEKYVYKRDDVRVLLSRLREANIMTFLLTNSHADYTNLLLNFAIGSDWRSLFTLVIVNGEKPSFFEATNKPFRVIDDATLQLETMDSRPLAIDGRIYSGGCVSLLEPVLRQYRVAQLAERGLPTCAPEAYPFRAAYVGDNIHSDIVVVHSNTSWFTIAVVEEMNDDDLLDLGDSVVPQRSLLFSSQAVSTRSRRRLEESPLQSSSSDDSESPAPRAEMRALTIQPSGNASPIVHHNLLQVPVEHVIPRSMSDTLLQVSAPASALSVQTVSTPTKRPRMEPFNTHASAIDSSMHLVDAPPLVQVTASMQFPFGRGYLRRFTQRWGSFFLAGTPGLDSDTPLLTHLGRVIVEHSSVVVPCITFLSKAGLDYTLGARDDDFTTVFQGHVPQVLRRFSPSASRTALDELESRSAAAQPMQL
ncbi:hypothetical protein CAOG_006659 [Capsaspora owczarzaki ATCC 30864]|uniref:Uncharacterized protein n=1 Tax=Capsaspora owczarzaki (strain ATCC 30864) TaxID=595528 RepID=A0A0D2VXE0_CAPO3|nr:hypothetical protein CAOG_006659 [Capsaspora owczarzaki ATCC 30864]